MTSSTLTATGANAPDGTAALWIDAENTSNITATTQAQTSSSSSGGGNATSVGLVLAFNTIGYDASNVLFNAVDALLGNALLGDENAGGATASASDSTLGACSATFRSPPITRRRSTR